MRDSAYFLLTAIVITTVNLPAAAEEKSVEIWPMPAWKKANPDEMGMDVGILKRAREYALTGGGSGFITRSGRVVMRWGDQKRRYDLKSTTKAIGVTAVGLALKDGKIKSLRDFAKKYHPKFGVPPESNSSFGWLDKITLFHLATQTAGFDKPGGYEKLLFEPGTKWSYSDGGPNWLAECITLMYGRDLNTLMFERVFGPIGIKASDLTWRNNAYRAKEIDGIKRREFGSGISANVDAMARIGYLYLRNGKWQGKEIIPGRFVDMARKVPSAVRGLPVVKPESYFNASDHYGLLWWNNADGTMAKVPRDTYWSWGLYDSLIVVIPSLDIVASRAGKSLNKESNANYKSIEPFIEPIALSVRNESSSGIQPYPSSAVIKDIKWAPVKTIVRKASGSDNWPITWADDDNLYSAYGDGWGFEPKTKKKLSLGIVKVSGSPPDFKGVNIRTESGERTGQGAKGAKASGMLCVDGVLYMLVRNVGNSQIAWSKDHGKTWRWCDWKFKVSFGYPTFLNFGKNYAGARDEFVYIYSPDSDSAYKPADRMVMARVAKDKIREQGGYEFFKGFDGNGKPIWTKEIGSRGAVFINPGRCYRSGISYNAGLKRYLWCQTIYGEEDMRFKGGLGIFDGPEPWGPWTTVYYTEKWDVGPGETSSFPTKWMSSDGKTCYLVFSGNDCFSVRKAVFQD
ncbi:MAG: serine hydrolase [Phycisphaerae bacterium]|nr:serine hydrolase [Phycisphaerae bacterium]NIP54923.1 serine hydrolase [Phycisphaerae bacterium]NIS53658.1 serine hydrolase [Phycisphaerae bacterium]NIU11214.1 serine hydrolase [Phycisphaerae bacterium]NIU59069.1 serine hydrolase [Phycisphaerae bacterium]